MKKMMMGFLIVLATAGAKAESQKGPQECGLPHFFDSEDGSYKEIKYTDLSGEAKVTKQQAREVIETSLRLTSNGVPTLLESVRSLREDSEGGDLVHETFLYKGVKYTQVKYWPGGNPGGIIFKNGKAIAENGDDSIFCLGENLPVQKK